MRDTAAILTDLHHLQLNSVTIQMSYLHLLFSFMCLSQGYFREGLLQSLLVT